MMPGARELAIAALLLAACDKGEKKKEATPFCPAAAVLAGGTLTGPGTEHSVAENSSSVRFTAAGSPHFLPPATAVGPNGRATWTVDPCAVVVARSGAGLQVGSGDGVPADAGELVAVGDADHPILLTGSQHLPDHWKGIRFSDATATSRLSHVVVEDAGDGVHGSAIVLDSATTGTGKPTPTIDHTVVRKGRYDGIVLRGPAARFGPGSGSNTVTGMGGAPLVADTCLSGDLPDGAYAGNGVGRVVVEPGVTYLLKDCGPIHWPKLSLPYLYRFGLQGYENWDVTLTIGAGVHVYVSHSPTQAGGAWDFRNGGSLQADGGSELGRIVIEGEGGQGWEGFTFNGNNPPVGTAAPSTMSYVTVKNAGLQASCAGLTCSDIATCRAVIILGAKGLLAMSHTELWGSATDQYGVSRHYCGDGSPDVSAGIGNVFKGPMHCAEGDQFDCATTCTMTCCQHNFACSGSVQ